MLASGIFERTHPDVVSALAESVQPRRFPPRHVVFRQGDPGSCFYLIASGKVKIVYGCRDGRQVVVNIAGPREIFGEVTAFDCGPREFTAISVTTVDAIAIERVQLMAWVTAHPEIGRQIMRLMARRIDAMTGCLVDLTLADPCCRLARRLLLFSKRFGRRDGDIVRVKHDLTLDEISQFAGVAPEHIGALLHDFEDRGWIRLENNCLQIVDAQSLAALTLSAPVEK